MFQTCFEGCFSSDWLSDEWKDWTELHEAKEFRDIVTKASSRLAAAKEKRPEARTGSSIV